MGLAASILDQIDHIGDWGLLATDADLVVTRWNRWLEQRSGLAAADVIGRHLFDIFPDLPTRKLDQYYQQVLGGQTVLLSQRFHKYVIPLPVADKFGPSHLQQTSRIVPLLDGSTVSGTLTLVEDVTERVAYEAELRARARQQTAVAVVARVALGGRGVADVVQEVVAQVRDTLDVDYTEVLARSPDGTDWQQLAGTGWTGPSTPAFAVTSTPRAQDGSATELDPAVLAADPYLRAHGVAGGLVVGIPAGNHPLAFLGAYARYPRQFSAGEVLFVQAVADVLGVAAERKRLEDELHLRVGELADAARRKDEFLAMLAHELRNPLAPIRNAAQVLLAKTGGDPDGNLLAAIIDRQVAQMARLIDDLLDVSRTITGKVTLRRERVVLAEVVAQAVETIRPLIDARRHELTIALPPDPIHLDADPARLSQVLGNLLNNAAKYTAEGGRIWLSARRNGGEVAVGIRDSGAGIPADMLPRVFDLFTQVDNTLDRAQGGLGIGLTLVRRLVELHGGTVQAASEGPGRGSEFVVRLAVVPGTIAAPGGGVKGLSESGFVVEPRNILIVDDNADSADSLAMLLGLTGHQTRTAYDGPSALDAARAHRPEVVLLDIGLPRMDGYEVAKRLRQEPGLNGVVLIAMTGYGRDDDRRKSGEAGFDHHLVKPIDPTELTALLASKRTSAKK